MRKRVLIMVFLFIAVFLLNAGSSNAFEFKGFGDVTYTESTASGVEGGFALGQLNFYVSQPLDDRTDVLVDFVIESEDTGEFIVDLERAQISYIFNDILKVRAGRFHNLLGYWNTAYHHGSQLQTSIDRPLFLEFEDDGGILPTHIVGLWAAGRTNTGSGVFNYGIMLGNGSKVHAAEALDPNNIGDDNGNKAISLRVGFEPNAMEGLGLGFSFYNATVSGFDATDTEVMRVKQNLIGFDVTYFAHNLELLGEYYIIKDEDDFGGGQKYSSSAYYVQAGYSIGKLTPYARFEDMSLDEDGDPYFDSTVGLDTAETERMILGARYSLSILSSIKAEARFVDDGTTNWEEYAVQWAFAF